MGLTTYKGAERLYHELLAKHMTVELATVAGEPGVVIRRFTVNHGKYFGKAVELAIKAPRDFPETPPAGFFVTPRLAPHGPESVNNESSPGLPGEWQYWSRQVPAWKQEECGRRIQTWLRTSLNDYGRTA